MLSGRGLCDELITRPEESYRLWCVVVCDRENLKNEEAMTRVGSQRHSKKIYMYMFCAFVGIVNGLYKMHGRYTKICNYVLTYGPLFSTFVCIIIFLFISFSLAKPSHVSLYFRTSNSVCEQDNEHSIRTQHRTVRKAL